MMLVILFFSSLKIIKNILKILYLMKYYFNFYEML